VQATPLLDRFLFSTFKKAFGGRVRFIVSGGAPLSTHVEDFLKVTLCTPVFQVSVDPLPLPHVPLFAARGNVQTHSRASALPQNDQETRCWQR
jgi:hypothetical protein